MIAAVDNGKSGTRVRLSGADGVRDLQLPGFSYASEGGIEQAWRSLARSIADAAGGPIEAATLALTAEPGDADEAKHLVSGFCEITGARRVVLCSDAVPGHLDAVNGDGLLVSAGTGTILIACAASGWYQADGWGPLLGDRGSGIDIGLSAARAALAARDGVGEPTALTGLLERHLGGLDLASLQRFLGAPDQVAQLAAFAEPACRAAAEGDAVAQAICARAGRDLADSASALLRRAGLPTDARIGLMGRIWGSELVRIAFAEAMRRPELPGVAIADPLRGGLELARHVPTRYLDMVQVHEVAR